MSKRLLDNQRIKIYSENCTNIDHLSEEYDTSRYSALINLFSNQSLKANLE